MKDFIKYALATMVGILLFTVVIAIVGSSFMAGVMAVSETTTKVHTPSIFRLELQGTVNERAADNPFASLMSNEQTELGLDDVLKAITNATENENIKGMYVEAKGISASPATLVEIHDALLKFRQSGKWIVAYGDTYSQPDYFICSVADKVILNPMGAVDWHGLASQTIFFTDLMKKAGVEMQIFKVGTYKSAVEPYFETKMSDANREQVTSFLNSIWSNMVDAVSLSRNLSPEELNVLADQHMVTENAETILNAGLVDTLLYMDGVKGYLRELMELDDDASLPTLTLTEVKNISAKKPLDKSGNIIAIYYAQGGIVQTPSNGNFSGQAEIASDKVITDLRKLRDDKSVKAVIFRVNSGGGSAYASEQIWREVVALKEKKPVIVSMGDMAASGGYYISCAADTIIAQPTTLTGSIGIFGMFPCAEELVNDKLALHFDVVKTNELGDFGTLDRKMNDREKAKMQKHIEEGYQTFITRCADGRGMTTEQIDAIGQGRVWTGEQALEIGLVDLLGDLELAEQIAAEKAGIENYSLIAYPEKDSPLALLKDAVKEDYIDAHVTSALGQWADDLMFLGNLNTMDHIQARMPYAIHIVD